ncbi:MAG: GGDEF domain-containing protein [Schwartzia sp.]|nr:GGDEF domain-containing protein [Schwartzia sp. (in: firmicutes)]
MGAVGILGALGAVLFLRKGIHDLPRNRRLPWKLFALGIRFTLLGEIGRLIFFAAMDAPGNYPAAVNIFDFFAAGLSFAAACAYLRQERMVNMRTLADVGLSMVVLAVLLIHCLIFPLAASAIGAGHLLFLLMLCAVYMLGFAGTLAILFFSSQRRHLYWANLLLGLGLGLWHGAGFFGLSVPMMNDSFRAMAVPLVSAGLLLVGFASCCPVPASRRARQRMSVFSTFKARRFWEHICLFLPDVLVFCLMLFLGVEYRLRGIIFFGAMLALVLVWLRQFAVIRRNEKLLTVVEENWHDLQRQKNELEQEKTMADRDASVDYLTQLYNRRYIDRALRRPKEAEDGLIRVGVLMIDVDFFKQVNDSLGHAAGDKVLQQVGAAIHAVASEKDIGGRYGGDEFVLLLYDASEESVCSAADALQEYVWSDSYLAEIPVTLSIGCTAWSGSIADYDGVALMAQADKALYQSKEQGRDQYTFMEMAQ